MGDEDPLDRETTFSAELTTTGVKASAKSRLIAAIDRLGGNIVEQVNVRLEEGMTLRRARIEGERKLLEAAVEYGVDRMGKDPDFAERALQQHMSGIFRKQENKNAVVAEALEDLRREPPTQIESESGEDQLSPAFMDRFEGYSEEASTEDLRQRWGKVLAAEIRKPGTFSSKVLRTVDELDAETAHVFERLCTIRINKSVPQCLSGKLHFHEVTLLTTAGLLVEVGLTGQIQQFGEIVDQSGREFWLFAGEKGAFSLPRPIQVPRPKGDQTPPLRHSDDKLSVPIYVLTDVGRSIATILPESEENALSLLIARIKEMLPEIEIRRFRKNAEGKGWVFVGSV